MKKIYKFINLYFYIYDERRIIKYKIWISTKNNKFYFNFLKDKKSLFKNGRKKSNKRRNSYSI